MSATTEETELLAQDELGFGARLTAARLAAEIPSGCEAARRAGMTQPHFWRLEKGIKEPLYTTAWRLIVRLWLPLEAFFPEQLIIESAARIQSRNRNRRA